MPTDDAGPHMIRLQAFEIGDVAHVFDSDDQRIRENMLGGHRPVVDRRFRTRRHHHDGAAGDTCKYFAN